MTRILSLPVGAKPLRSMVDFTESGVAEVNEVIQRAREEFVERMGLGDMLNLNTQSAPERTR